MSMAPGWYPDPFSSAGFLRWWDGTRWTTRTVVPGADQRPPQPYPPQLAQPGFPVASWWPRFGAYLVDVLIISILLAPAYIVALWPALHDLIDAIPTDGSPVNVSVITDFETRVLGMSLVLTLMSLVVSFAYVVPQHVRYGRTLGKRALGIRVRMLAEDRTPRWGEASVRWAVLWVGASVAGGLFLLVDCLWPLWDKPWSQALHDKAAKTVVVPTR